ncbi:gamma interferon responsive lysosomal thiol reductase family protein [Striga asiatica]|uniref:Gamma interferon responsive lysosomal thiol reductase family protein n=1 Tax=Striga asiatica TaxID=4170 RepID=A0A5A7RJZ6_STRAF|nr:gamma interferon responsive lysosomal thiol reductase family protein [Striga asiatica]
MSKSCATAVALFCLFAISLADHAPLVEAEASTLVTVYKVPDNTEKQFNTLDVSSVPLPKFPFRAVNRRFPVRSRRPCAHGRRERKENEQISYGNDMIFSSGENSDFEEPVVYGGGKRISGRWLGPHHHHYHGGRDGEDRHQVNQIVFDGETEIEVLKKLGKHLRLQRGEKEMKGESGFMRRVRKFLKPFF